MIILTPDSQSGVFCIFVCKFQLMNFVVYKSSAGSGKTFTLVKEYIKLIIKNPSRFRNILAITFTNKAANEMKERVLVSLKEISDFETHPESGAVEFMLPMLEQETGLTQQEIVDNSEVALKLILHNFSEFAINTIDSFVHKIIRSFAFDLNLPLNFEVEVDSNELLQKVIDLLISQVGSNKNLTDLLVQFTRSKIGDEKSWHIENDLQNVAKLLLNDDGQSHIKKLKDLKPEDFKSLNKKTDDLISAFEKKIRGIADPINEKIIQGNIPHDAFYQGRSGISKYFENLANGNYNKVFPNSYVVKTVEEDKWFSGKITTEDEVAILSIKEEIIRAYDELQDIIAQSYSDYIILIEIRKNLYPLAVINEIEKVLNEYKSANSIVLIDEFNRKISDIVMEEPAPFIYERLGEKYKHFLIDEFQDTSVLQWHNLLPLLENSLAESNFNMIVGDGKQSIYRWRNGEVEQFAALPKIINSNDDELLKTREQSLVRNYNEQVLKNNFRSKAEIVAFNNDFFEVISEKINPDYKGIYDDVKQNYDNDLNGGFVSIDFPGEPMAADVYTEWNLAKVKSTLEQILEDGYQQNDVAVLCRDNRHASEIAAFLLQNDYNVVSSESLLLMNSPEVRFLIATMKFLNNNDDQVSVLEMVEFMTTNNLLTQEFHELVDFIFKDKNKITQKYLFTLEDNGIVFKVRPLLKLSIYDLAEELIRTFKLNTSPDPYLQFLLDAVLKFSIGEDTGLKDFLTWWETQSQKLSIVVSEGMDAIRIMTIHKAKGLEFPVVIFPFANTKHKLTKRELWIDYENSEIPDLKAALVNTSQSLVDTRYAELYEEEKAKSFLDLINMLYVVMTRPTDRLYIFSELPPKSRSKSNSESFPKLFKYYLESKGLWLEDQATYFFGESTKVSSKTISGDEPSNLYQFISNSWRGRMRIRYQAPDHWDIDNPEGAIEYGKLIHLIMAEIKSEEDVDSALDKFVTDGIIETSELDNIRPQIIGFIQNPEISPFFRKDIEVKNEKDILLSNGHVIRPDRLIFNADKVSVIDFKTGKPEQKHIEQIQFYKATLKELGYHNIQGVLIYLLNKGFVKYV